MPAARPSMATNIAPWPCCLKLRGFRFELLRSPLTPCDFKKRRFADEHAPPIDVAADAAAGGRCEIRDVRRLDAALGGAAHDRGGERMLAVRFDGGGGGEQFLLGDRSRGNDVRQARFAFGQRAGLIHDQRVHLFHPLDRRGVLDQHAGLRAATDADHDRHRRRESERAGTGDDQHGDGIHDRVREARLRSEPDPGDEGQHRDAEDGRHKPARHFVGEALDRRAAALRLRDHLDDLREHRVAPDALGAHEKAAGAIHRAAGDFVAGRLLDRHRLAGEHRFIDVRLPLDDPAIDRHFLAGAHAQLIAALHFIERHFAFFAVANDDARSAARDRASADRAAGAAAGAQFEHLSEQDEHGDHRRRFEVDADLAVLLKRRRKDAGREHHDRAVEPRHADADRDQREHVEVSVDERLPAAHEERPARPQHDRRAQRELHPARRIAVQPTRARPATGAPSRPGRPAAVSAAPIQKRRVMSRSSALSSSPPATTFFGSSAIPHFGQFPG